VSEVFAALRGRLSCPVRDEDLPKSLFERFERNNPLEQMEAFLTAVAGASPSFAHGLRGRLGDTQRMVLGKAGLGE